MTSSSVTSVTKGLNLSLRLRDPKLMWPLLGDIRKSRAEISTALKELHYVHFARFLPVDQGRILLVITEYDGDFESYVMDFAMTIGDVFSRILKDVAGYKPAWLPVKDHPREFFAFIQKHNKITVLDEAGKPFTSDRDFLFSVYPHKTVLNIIGQRGDLPNPVKDAAPPGGPLNLADIQGNILKGYRGQLGRHFALAVTDAALARQLLARLIVGDSSCPKITTAAPWGSVKPEYCLTIGLTYQGLLKLGVAFPDLEQFPGVFREGPANLERAKLNGDAGDSDRKYWVLGGLFQPVHLMMSLYADLKPTLDFQSGLLSQAFGAHGLTLVHAPFDTQALSNDAVPFGYRDSIAQPRIAGFHNGDDRPDMQPLASAGEFLLGSEFLDVYGGKSLGSLPQALAQNATYAAVRIMAQDVETFEKLLDSASKSFGIDRELVAAKIMGRWRDGTPLSTAHPSHGSSSARVDINRFDYAPSAENPDVFDDYDGARCPVGAHIRRMNPRSAMVAGKPHTRRIIRRGAPYSWVNPDDGSTEYGVFGLFICADLNRQFEFLLHSWANGDISANGILGTKDPIVGAQQDKGQFRFRLQNPDREVSMDVPQLVKTRGSVYLFMPGIEGLRYLSTLQSKKLPLVTTKGLRYMTATIKTDFAAIGDNIQEDSASGAFDPAKFNPTDSKFLQNPYPTYVAFRANAPVAKVIYPDIPGRKSESGFWVFDEAQIQNVCGSQKKEFLKKPVGFDLVKRGIFTMDPPDHTFARTALDQMVAAIIALATASAKTTSNKLLTAILKSPKREIDFVNTFAEPMTREVFFEVFGLPDPTEQKEVVDAVAKIFEYTDPTKTDAQQKEAEKAVSDLATRFFAPLADPLTQYPPGTLISLLKTLSGNPIHRIGHAASFCVGGYLSNQFLLTLGLHHILGNPFAKAEMASAVAKADTDPGLLKNAIDEIMRFDAPLQMAERYAAKDTTLGGVPIKKNDKVTLVYGSANRDAAIFTANPDLLNLTRAEGPGFAFGNGIHECIAYAMAYTVAMEGFKALFTLLPNVVLKNPIAQFYPSPYYRRIDSLIIKF